MGTHVYCSDFYRQQKAAKDEEKARLAAEKAAEDAALKEKQARIEEEQRKKKEEERQRREAARKAQEEEKQKKEEERRKRIAEEKEREAERERKKKEKEEKLKAERREKEEKERKAKEDREAKVAADRAEKARREKEQREKEEEEKEKLAKLAKEKEEKEKAEREAKERERVVLQQQQQQRIAASKANRTGVPAVAAVGLPSPPRVNTIATASSSLASLSQQQSSQQRQLPTSPVPKKILNKPSSIAQSTSQQSVSNSARNVGQRQLSESLTQPSTPITSQPQGLGLTGSMLHVPPSSRPSLPNIGVYANTAGPATAPIIPPTMSPRTPYTPVPIGTFSSYASVPSSLHSIPSHSALAPSAIPRSFGNTAGGQQSFDQTYARNLAPSLPPAPIGPPSKVNVLSSPTIGMGPGVGPPVRRSSVIADPGPIGRPIAPIARPSGSGSGDTTVGTTGSGSSRSGATSPIRRSPSPKVLGSSALAADDDEVVTVQNGRRGGHGLAPGSGPGSIGAPVGQGLGWHSSRPSVNIGAPWGNINSTPVPGGGFGSPRPGSTAPGSLWGSSNPLSADWHHPAPGAPSSFFGSQFIAQQPSPPPHHAGN